MTGTRRRPNYVEVLNALGQELTLASGGRGGYAAVARAARGILGVAGCGLHVIDRRTAAPVAEALAFDGPAPPMLQGLDGGIAQWMADHRVPLSLPDPTGASPFALPPGFPFRILALPLFHKDALRGVLTLYAATGREPWFLQKGAATADVAEFQRAISGQMGLFIEKRSLEATSTLFKEIHHRVKNNLQTVASLLRMQMRRLDRVSAEDALRQSINRILSIAQVHETLSEAEIGVVDVGELLGRITGLLTRDMPQPPDIRLELPATPLLLSSREATPLALVFNELVGNALEHGLGERAEGTVRVRLAVEGGEVVLSVADDGAGLPAGFDPARDGNLGLTIVTTLVDEELGGHLTLDAGAGGRGTVALARFPLPSPETRESEGPGHGIPYPHRG